MPRPLCVPCKLEMRCLENDIAVTFCGGSGKPWRIFNGDKWGCPECLAEIVVGWAPQPAGKVGQPAFDLMLKLSKLEVP